MRKNSLLSHHFENLDVVPASDEVAEGFEAAEELNAAEDAVETADSELEAVAGAAQDLQEIKDAQDVNIKIMEEDKTPEEAIEEVAERDAEVKEELEENEAVLSEKLPESEEEAVDAIEEQAQKEQLAVESIIARSFPSIKAGFNKSATSQLYAHFGIRTQSKGLVTCQEARRTSSPRANAIALYKASSEGLGETIKGLGKAAWQGIKNFIKMIVDFIKSLFSSKERIRQSLSKFDQRVKDIMENINDYTLSDDFKKGITEVTPASVVLATKNPESYIDEIIKGYQFFKAGANALEKDFNNPAAGVMLGNLPQVQELARIIEGREFNGVVLEKGKTVSTADSSIAQSVQSINLKFGSVSDVCKCVERIVEVLKDGFNNVFNAIEGYHGEMKKYMNLIEKHDREVAKQGEKSKEQVKETKNMLKTAKRLISVPKAFIGACKLGLSGVVKSGSKDSSSSEA